MDRITKVPREKHTNKNKPEASGSPSSSSSYIKNCGAVFFIFFLVFTILVALFDVSTHPRFGPILILSPHLRPMNFPEIRQGFLFRFVPWPRPVRKKERTFAPAAAVEVLLLVSSSCPISRCCCFVLCVEPRPRRSSSTSQHPSRQRTKRETKTRKGWFPKRRLLATPRDNTPDNTTKKTANPRSTGSKILE